jgi:hypothetical protein
MDISYPFNIGDAQSNNVGTCLDTNLMQQVFDIILKSGIDGSSNKVSHLNVFIIIIIIINSINVIIIGT